MINKKVHISKIHFTHVESESLIESIAKRGVAIAVQVNVHDDYYECLDGNKRLTACKILSLQDKKFEMVPVMIMNDYSKAGSAFWGIHRINTNKGEKMERLQKTIAKAGIASRRKAEELIVSGKVKSDGVVVTELEHKYLLMMILV